MKHTPIPLSTFFLVRHIATGQFLPALRKSGATHWNPGNQKMIARTRGVPRLFKNKGYAQGFITYWARYPNQYIMNSENGLEWDDKPDDRQASDLEIIQVWLYDVYVKSDEVNR